MNYSNIINRFHLPRRGRKHTCPNCGGRKCFRRYVDEETGKELADACGICDHANRCGYHYPPRELFRDHPELRPDDSMKPDATNGNAADWSRMRWQLRYTSEEYHQTEFFPLSWAEKAAGRESTFSSWFMQLPWDDELKRKVLAEYYVGATEKDIIVGGENRGKAAVFWMIDEQQRVHDAKLIAYNPDGHRVQGWGNSMRSICEKSKRGPQLEQTEKVLFGLHLMDRYPEKRPSISWKARSRHSSAPANIHSTYGLPLAVAAIYRRPSSSL